MKTELKQSVSLKELCFTFLEAGCLGFGGFMSLISVVEKIIVEKKKYLEPQEILDGIVLASLLPGAQAVNLVAYCGNKLRGTWGAIVAVCSVILPSFLLMLFMSYLYSRYGEIKEVQQFFKGFVPAITAVIFSVAWRMLRKNLKTWIEISLMLAAILALVFIPKEFRLYVALLLVLVYGLAGSFLFRSIKAGTISFSLKLFPWKKIIFTTAMVVTLILGLYMPVAPAQYNSLFNLSKTFAGLSVMLFGGGYVIIPMMQHTIVDVFQWMSAQSFKDGIGLSQMMPGPILITTAFIGFRVHGVWGSLISTISIFAPPAVVMIVASQIMEFFKQSKTAEAIMRGIRCGVVGMIFFAAYELTQLADYSSATAIWPSVVIFLAALIALMKFNMDVVYVIPIAGVAGFFLYR